MGRKVAVTKGKSSIISHCQFPQTVESELADAQNAQKPIIRAIEWLKMAAVPFPIGKSALVHSKRIEG